MLIVAKTIAFFLVVTLIGGALFPASKGWLQRVPIIGHFNLRQLLTMQQGNYNVLSLLLIAVLVGLLAHYFGFHPAVGAYMAGLIIRQEYFTPKSDGDNKSTDGNFEEVRVMIDNVAFSWLGPVFFVALGNKLIFDSDLLLSVLPQALFLFGAIFVGQILSASLAAKYTGHFSWADSWMIGFGMLGRAELAFVVMEIAYVQNNVMSADAFYTLMICCFMLNVSVPLTIRWWKSHFLSSNSE